MRSIRRQSVDDDLRVLAALLSEPGPSSTVFDAGRRRLLNEIRGHGSRPAGVQRGGPRASRHRATWVAGVALPAAAAAAAAAVLAAPLLAHAPARRVASPAARSSSAAQVLLAAAVTASRQHPGRYWHVEERDSPATQVPPAQRAAWTTDQDWIATENGTVWSWQPRCGDIPAGVVRNGPGASPVYYAIGIGAVTWQVTTHLPTRPAALYAWLAYHEQFVPVGPPTPVPVAGMQARPPRYHYVHLSAATVRLDVAWTLIALASQAPAPAAVRAAAYRALAAFPGITRLGRAEGGQELLISFRGEPSYVWIRVIIDPATARLSSVITSKGTSDIVIAQWVNRLPRIVSLAPTTGCGR
jgi:hypothetical protein